MANDKFEKYANKIGVCVLLILCCLASACSSVSSSVPSDRSGEAPEQEAKMPAAQDSAETIQPLEISTEALEETAQNPESTGILSSAADIALHDVDGHGRNYAFVYKQEEFSAQYTEDNWKIIDSYRIVNAGDMVVICQALLDVHPVHGRDMQSIRTAEDMAFEWQQHNLAYELLPADHPWRQNAKDVDLNPADQGKSAQEIYEERTGRKFRVEDFLS